MYEDPNLRLSDAIKSCVFAIKAGKTVVIPTDTIWGISCDALNEDAISNIYKIKNRAENKPLILLFKDINSLKAYFNSIPDQFYELYDQNKEAVTYILPDANEKCSSILKSEDHKMAIRIPEGGIIKSILEGCNNPITSTSANISDQPAAVLYSDIKKELLQKVDYIFPHKIINEKDTVVKKASKIIEIFSDGSYKIIRK